MVSQLWPLRCSQATSRRRRVSDGNPRVRCTWRWAESTRSCFRSAAAAASSQHARLPVCKFSFRGLQHCAMLAQEASCPFGWLSTDATAVCNNDSWQHSLPMVHAALWDSQHQSANQTAGSLLEGLHAFSHRTQACVCIGMCPYYICLRHTDRHPPQRRHGGCAASACQGRKPRAWPHLCRGCPHPSAQAPACGLHTLRLRD